MMRHKRSQVDHERFIKILKKEKTELEESLTKMEARLILALESLRKLECTTWAHSTLLFHKKNDSNEPSKLSFGARDWT